MFANICDKLINVYDDVKPVIISPSKEISIKEVTTMICDIIGFKNKIIFDTTKPDGQFRKPSDNTHLKSIIGNYQFTPIKEGLEETINYFLTNYNTIRK